MKRFQPIGSVVAITATLFAALAARQLFYQEAQIRQTAQSAAQQQTPSPRQLDPDWSLVPRQSAAQPSPTRRRLSARSLTRPALDSAPAPVPDTLPTSIATPRSAPMTFTPTPTAASPSRSAPLPIDLSDTRQPLFDQPVSPSPTLPYPEVAVPRGTGPQVRIQRRGEPTPLDEALQTQAQWAPLYIEQVPEPTTQRRHRYYPSFNALTPSGFGANQGDVFMGAAIVDREVGLSVLGPGAVARSDSGKAGGSAAIGFGLGDAGKFLGLETTYNLISLTPSRFASNGSFDFKVHRRLGKQTAIAVGWENAINYGPEAGGTDSSVYGVLSTVIPLQPNNPNNPMLLGLSAGVGGGRFRTIQDQIDGKDSVGVLGSVGLQVAPNASVITEWSGSSLNLGVSYVPFRSLPLFLSGTAIDIANSTGFGTRYAISGSLGFNFR
ncbi:hypothetical protein [Trichothermofontia sp.]